MLKSIEVSDNPQVCLGRLLSWEVQDSSVQERPSTHFLMTSFSKSSTSIWNLKRLRIIFLGWEILVKMIGIRSYTFAEGGEVWCLLGRDTSICGCSAQTQDR